MMIKLFYDQRLRLTNALNIPKIFKLTITGVLILLCNLWLSAQQGIAEYYEKPVLLNSAENLRYPQAFTVNDHIVLLYQKISLRKDDNGDVTGGEIAVSGRISRIDGSLGDEFIIVSGLPFEGTVAPPLLFSATADDHGRVWLAYARAAQTIAVLSADGPTSKSDNSHNNLVFRERGIINADTTIVTPRIYLKPNGGGLVVLATRGSSREQSTLMSRSSDGRTWSAFQAVDSEFNGHINSNPSWARIGKREYLAFQSLTFADQVPGTKVTFQIYTRYSDDEGKTWSPIQLVSAFVGDKDLPDITYQKFTNQRPLLVSNGDQLQLFWERGFQTDPPQIFNLSLNAEGLGAAPAVAVTDSNSGAFAPTYTNFGGKEYLSWFSSAARSSEGFISVRTPQGWRHKSMSNGFGGSALYPSFAFANGKLHYFYYYRTENDAMNTRLVWIEPNQRMAAPRLDGLNFSDNQRDRRKELRVKITPAPDVSGFAAYNLVISRSSTPIVPPKPAFTDIANPPPLLLEGDGEWFIAARTMDKAGNWSESVSMRYILDTTPPDPVKFMPLPVDEKGYLRSNTFSVGWQKPAQDDVQGYDWSLQYLGDISISEAMAKSIQAENLPVMGRQDGLTISRNNVENGIYLLAVWADDAVGNRSAVRFTYLFANKYIPSTVIRSIDVRQDVLGKRFLDVHGRGFNQNGVISRIVLDRDGLEPYDYVYNLDKGDYSLVSDYLIQGLRLENVKTANYLLGVYHSERGMEFSGRRLAFEERGVIKFGDFALTPEGSFHVVRSEGIAIQAGDILLWLIMAFLALIAIISIRQLRMVYRDSVMLEQVAVALIEGTSTPVVEELRKVQNMKSKRLGLRIKFAGFFLALTIAVVLLISLPLSSYTLSRQKAVLAEGLQKRLEVLMESLQSSANIYLRQPDQYSTELLQLTGQGSIMSEVSYITITAQGRNKADNFDIVLASSDKRITGDQAPPNADEPPVLRRGRTSYQVAGKDENGWFPGLSGISDQVSPLVPKLRLESDKRFRQGLGSLPADLAAYNQQLKGLLLNTTPQGQAEVARIDNIRRELSIQLNKRMQELAGSLASLPTYDFNNYNNAVTDYIFYKPIFYAQASDKPESANYYRGMIRIGVSTLPINQTIASTQQAIIWQLILFIFLAIGMGIVLAIVLSAIIVGPIRGLVDEVNKIKGIISLEVNAQVQKFEEYAKQELILKSNDELADLNETFNEMVHVMSKAADANVDLYAGKDVQRKFLPLDKRSDGKKGTTGAFTTDHLDVFGYYEGAWGVSGDYFDYKRITKDTIAFIKCDISGKGVSAALIMVEVATLFQNYFDNWEATHPAGGKGGKPLLSPLVTSINDLIADREFVGKFAAMNIVLLNEKTGECTFCNAGDEKVFIYRAAERKVELFYLTNQRAAGALSSKIFPFEYKEDHNRLNPGDMLLYFTDGIEEAQSLLRDSSLNPAPVTRDDIKAGLFPPGTAGQLHEELGIERINAVVEAIMRRGSYELKKIKDPTPDRQFIFNFRDSRGTAEDAVLYLAAVERVFRLIPYTNLTDKDRIQIDKMVDDRMQQCFEQYADYFFDRAHEKDLAARKLAIEADLAKLQGTKFQKEFEPQQRAYDEEKMAYENERRAFESEMKRSGGALEDPEREAALEARREKLQELEKNLFAMPYKQVLVRLQEYERDLKEEENSLYRTFGNLREDPQFDDLTLLAIRKL